MSAVRCVASSGGPEKTTGRFSMAISAGAVAISLGRGGLLESINAERIVERGTL